MGSIHVQQKDVTPPRTPFTTQDQHIFRDPELKLYFLPNRLGSWNTPSSKIAPKYQPGFRELVQYFLEPITSRSCIDLVKWMRWTWYFSKWVCVLLKTLGFQTNGEEVWRGAPRNIPKTPFTSGGSVDRRNPTNQLIGSLSHCFQGFIHPKWCRISSINSMTGRLGKQFHFLVNHHLLGAKVTTGCSKQRSLWGLTGCDKTSLTPASEDFDAFSWSKQVKNNSNNQRQGRQGRRPSTKKQQPSTNNIQLTTYNKQHTTN